MQPIHEPIQQKCTSEPQTSTRDMKQTVVSVDKNEIKMEAGLLTATIRVGQLAQVA